MISSLNTAEILSHSELRLTRNGIKSQNAFNKNKCGSERRAELAIKNHGPDRVWAGSNFRLTFRAKRKKNPVRP